MTPFGDNFKAGKQCPFCLNHPDSQENGFLCTKLNQLIDIKGNYSDIFGNHFPEDLVKTLFDMYNFREEHRKLTTK